MEKNSSANKVKPLVVLCSVVCTVLSFDSRVGPSVQKSCARLLKVVEG